MNKNSKIQIGQRLEKDFISLSTEEKNRFNKLFYVYNAFSSFFLNKPNKSSLTDDDFNLFCSLIPEAENFHKEFFEKNLKSVRKKNSYRRFSLYNIFIPNNLFEKIDEKTLKVSVMKNDEFNIQFENDLNDFKGLSISFLSKQNKIQFTTWVLNKK